jgi:hypothetical protein
MTSAAPSPTIPASGLPPNDPAIAAYSQPGFPPQQAAQPLNNAPTAALYVGELGKRNTMSEAKQCFSQSWSFMCVFCAFLCFYMMDYCAILRLYYSWIMLFTCGAGCFFEAFAWQVCVLLCFCSFLIDSNSTLLVYSITRESSHCLLIYFINPP